MRRGESVALLVFQPHKYSMPHQVRQAHFYIYFNGDDLCVWHMTVQTGCSSKSAAAAKYICVWHVTVQTGCSSKSAAAAKYICVWHVTVQTGCSCCSLSAQSIHLREKNIAGPTERSSKGGMPPLLIARREGPAFFDEDDLCAAYETSMQPV